MTSGRSSAQITTRFTMLTILRQHYHFQPFWQKVIHSLIKGTFLYSVFPTVSHVLETFFISNAYAFDFWYRVLHRTNNPVRRQTFRLKNISKT